MNVLPFILTRELNAHVVHWNVEWGHYLWNKWIRKFPNAGFWYPG